MEEFAICFKIIATIIGCCYGLYLVADEEA